MLQINKTEFLANLRLTQAYCEQQLQHTKEASVAILRSFNPVYEGGRAFLYYQYDSLAENSETQRMTLVDWSAAIDPFDNDILTELFERQLKHKLATDGLVYKTESAGKILVLDYERNIPDGASAVESFGFVDNYDFPPIDTWFYKANYEDRWILFAWIPQQFVKQADLAIDVHCLDVLHWFEDWLPSDHHNIIR